MIARAATLSMCLAASIGWQFAGHMPRNGGHRGAGPGRSLAAGRWRAGDGDHDPCTLVTRHEAEVYLGSLIHDPYRTNPATGLRAVADGETCLYRARDGHSIEIRPQWAEGQTTMAMYGNTQDLMNSVLQDEGSQLDTLGGDWDEMRWIIGDLFVLKGDTIVEVDVKASNAGAAGAADLARHAVARLQKPLVYNGAAAGRTAPGPLVEPRDPCSVLSRKEVELIVGPLTSSPVSGTGKCTYPVVPRATGARSIDLLILWSGGFGRMFQEHWAGGQAVAGLRGRATSLEAGTPGVQKAVDQLNEVLGRRSARDKIKLEADTAAIVGPWVEARIVSGVTFTAVKKDVYMEIDLRTLPLDQARALVGAAMAKF